MGFGLQGNHENQDLLTSKKKIAGTHLDTFTKDIEFNRKQVKTKKKKPVIEHEILNRDSSPRMNGIVLSPPTFFFLPSSFPSSGMSHQYKVLVFQG